jgi:colicin import membrane protein
MTAEPAEDTGTELVSVEGKPPVEIFAEEHVAALLKQCEAIKDAYVHPDITTDAGRREVKSFAFRFTKTKTKIDDLGGAYVKIIKEEPKRIDAARKKIRDTLDKWADEIKAPVTALENAEKARKAAHQANLDAIEGLVNFSGTPSSALVQERQDKLNDLVQLDYEEFTEAAKYSIKNVDAALAAMLADAKKYEAEQAELAKLRKDKAERDEKDRLERIRQEGIAEGQRLAATEAQRKAATPAPAPSPAPASPPAPEPVQPVEQTPEPEQPEPEIVTFSLMDLAAPSPLTPHGAQENAVMALHLATSLTQAQAREAIDAIAANQIPNVSISY